LASQERHLPSLLGVQCPTVTFASETQLLNENVINKLMIFERRIMRKIFGPTRTDDGYWRIKTNQEINEILKGQNIIGFI